VGNISSWDVADCLTCLDTALQLCQVVVVMMMMMMMVVVVVVMQSHTSHVTLPHSHVTRHTQDLSPEPKISVCGGSHGGISPPLAPTISTVKIETLNPESTFKT
jgi:hypothetical protein